MPHKTKSTTFDHSLRGVKESDSTNLDISVYSCCITVLDIAILQSDVTNDQVIKI
jgi:hypothetical protein